MRRPEARQEGGLRALDRALADVLVRLDPATPEAVREGAALASLAVGLGHAAFDPARPELLLPDGDPGAWGDRGDWLAAFAASCWVDAPAPGECSDPARPLVYEHGLLYLRRYREYEHRLAGRLRTLAAMPDAAEPHPATRALLDVLFPGADAGDRQAEAARAALRKQLLLVTGGPGTGKTTTIARVLLLLLAQAAAAQAPPPRIALAAPTGRAADRMADSLRRAATQLRGIAGIDPALCDALPQDASTLHRLLGSIPDSPRFRHDAAHPLPFDVIVVDEASMVDLPLMCKLAEAVPDGARLLFLGDPDQLPSVEAGDVLSAIVAAGEAHALCRVHLVRGYRQHESLALQPLADALRSGEADTALALLRGGALAGVHFHEDEPDPLATHGETLVAHWRALADAEDPGTALARAAELRLLTALRDGPQGARTLNARIEQALAGPRAARHFHGRLLQVTENSYRHGLFNGDVGVCLRDAEGGVTAWFPGSDGPRPFHPASLPAHESAFAMTVHKAQGSEFDRVWLLLPRHDARTLSRELLYTAVTRARAGLHVCAGEDAIRAACARRATRVSGLAHKLLRT